MNPVEAADAMDELICPDCGARLSDPEAESISCSCGARYGRIEGILVFAQPDSFYEGKFGAEEPARPNRFISLLKRIYTRASIYDTRAKHGRLYRKLRGKRSDKVLVLDLGCGGGNPALKLPGYHVVGVDLSISSLVNAREIYDEVFMASIARLPFPDNTFDCVCSFDVIGHLPNDLKSQVVSEIKRVAKTGALSFHYVELDAPRGFMNWAKKEPKLYWEHFIEKDGHFGLEGYRDVLARFRENDFSLVGYKCLAKIVLLPGEISKRFDNRYKKMNLLVRVSVALDKMICSNPVMKAVFGIMFKPVQVLIEPLIPDEYGGLLFVAHTVR